MSIMFISLVAIFFIFNVFLYSDVQSYEKALRPHGFDNKLVHRRPIYTDFYKNKNKKNKKTKTKHCHCPNDRFPLCGSDGKTYKNDCYFRCNQRRDPYLIIVEDKYCFEIEGKAFLDHDN